MADTEPDNVVPLRPHGVTSGATSGAPVRRKKDHRAAARQARKRSKIKVDRDATVRPTAPKAIDIPRDISRDISPVEIDPCAPCTYHRDASRSRGTAYHVRDTPSRPQF
jgi:hypothetical protein